MLSEKILHFNIGSRFPVKKFFACGKKNCNLKKKKKLHFIVKRTYLRFRSEPKEILFYFISHVRLANMREGGNAGNLQ